VTKLDGTAKGGVVFALAREFGIPIRYAGIGERPEDLRVFDAEAFVDALLPESVPAVPARRLCGEPAGRRPHRGGHG
jgi:fused signal recognition particle receptor